jgi:hypothetical protein
MAAALLGALFKEIYERLGRDPEDNPEMQMNAWSQGSTSHGVYFTSVLKAANESLASMPKHLADQRQKISTEIDIGNLHNWHQDLYQHFCLEAAESLAMGLQRLKHDKFIIAFDECTNIKPPVPIAKRVVRILSPVYGISLLALQRMIKTQDPFSIQGFNFWFLFLDTSFTTAEFSHSRNEVSSARHTALRPLPPWLYLGLT